MSAWLEADGIDTGSYKTLMRAWVNQAYDGGPDLNPIRALERGECTEGYVSRVPGGQHPRAAEPHGGTHIKGRRDAAVVGKRKARSDRRVGGRENP